MSRFGLNEEQLARLLDGSLKPEEIDGTPEIQHRRIRELLAWFARPPEFAGNPKWLRSHAMELAYYIATGGKLESIDLSALTRAAFIEGLQVPEGSLLRDADFMAKTQDAPAAASTKDAS